MMKHMSPTKKPAKDSAPVPAPKKQEVTKVEGPSYIKGELCPFCNKKTLALMESEMDIPYFGKAYIFSMDCENPECGYHKADVESAEEGRGSAKYTLEIDSEEDMKIRVVKSSSATIKIPHIGSIEPGEAANGYVTNVEGILQRMKKQIERLRDDSEDEDDKKKAKNMLKKLTRVMWGQEKLKITLEDPNGNSAIISPKAVKGK
ncbi:ZPR1 zinc finger domain-containing protein [Candidatus Woesearchaeota archaeon]|nr:ZPR1 zinc finger domain-containing protein [Candidatus Woesearchaeota archaeon]